MKTRRIVSSLALAAALALGASGCGLIAPQGTLDPYAPSDGIDVNLEGVDVRNLLLVADETGEHFNVVFTGVNQGESPVLLRMTFVDESGSSNATADFLVQPGVNVFGHPDGDVPPTLVSIPGLIAGATVDTYFEVAGGGEEQRRVPALDGTLVEYEDYVVSPSQLRAEELVELDAELEAEVEADGDTEVDSDAAAEEAPAN